MLDVANRLANRVQLTTDGHYAYLEAVEGAFGADVDFATLVKLYGQAPEGYRALQRWDPLEQRGCHHHSLLATGLRPCAAEILKRSVRASLCRQRQR